MFSSDRNIEKFTLLIEKLKRYVELKTDYLKFDTSEKLVRIITALISFIVLFFILMVAFFYLSMAIVAWIEPIVGKGWGYCIVAGVCFVAFLIVLLFKRQIIEKPVLRLITELFLIK